MSIFDKSQEQRDQQTSLAIIACYCPRISLILGKNSLFRRAGNSAGSYDSARLSALSIFKFGTILQNSLFFSLLARNLAVETGSTWTASATSGFNSLRDCSRRLRTSTNDMTNGRFAMDFAQSAPAALQRITDATGASIILILSDIRALSMRATSQRRQ
jgi:hypothetical protein